MAFINKKYPTNLKVKITSKGRDLLSQGKLNFKYFEIGDSEIDYEYAELIGIDNYKPLILSPFDKNPKILSHIYSGDTTGTTYISANINNPKQYISTTGITSIGFFSGNTILADSNHVKQPNIQIEIDEVSGGSSLNLYQSSGYTLSPEPEVNDMLMVKWINKRGSNTNNNLISNNTPHLFYKITGITGTLSGNNLSVGLDRDIPDYSLVTGSTGKIAGGLIFYNKEFYENDPKNSVDYVSENVLKFIDNFQCDIIKYPLWNLNIIYSEEIAGVNVTNLKYNSFYTTGLTGFVNYIQNQISIIKKLGVIHYTNSSPNNTYGEGFYHNTPILDVPTLMWHRSSTTMIGLSLSGGTFKKTLSGLNITYYDLVDNSGYVVGKIFDGLKLFLIEDQELLFAMSFKSNRNWTLPKLSVFVGDNNLCTTTVYVPTTTVYSPTTTVYVPTTTYIPLDAIQFENNNEYITFENNNEYITFENTPALRLLWDDIINAPVGNVNSVSDWNTFMQVDTNADTPFSEVIVRGNEINLIGSTNLRLNDSLFVGTFSTHLISVIDDANCISSVGSGCFADVINYLYYCDNLTTVILPTCTHVYSYGFYNCTSLAITNFNMLNIAEDYAFYNCTTLTGFTAPVATSFNNYTFGNCSSIITVIADNLITAGDGCFSYTSAATYYDFPSLLTGGSSCFAMSYDTSLLSINIPIATTIGDTAFYGCSSLTSIYAPNCVNLGSDSTVDSFMFHYLEHGETFTVDLIDFYNNINQGLSTISGSSFNYTTGRFTTPNNYFTITVPSSLLTDNMGTLNRNLAELLYHNAYRFGNPSSPNYPPVPDWSTLPTPTIGVLSCGYNIKIITELGEYVPNVPFEAFYLYTP